jgi:hypothetical protein
MFILTQSEGKMDAYVAFVNSLMVILRPAHVILGMLWFGYGTVSTWILFPAAAKMGAKGDSLLRSFYTYSRYGALVGMIAGLTTLIGIIIWPVHMRLAGFTPTGEIIFGIGALFGVLAAAHGGAATGRAVAKFVEAGKAVEENADPTSEQLSAYEAAKKKMMTHANISAWITLVAVLGMAFARYFP